MPEKIYNITIILLIAIAVKICYQNFNSNNGIYDISDGTASYIAGEACTINTPIHKSVEQIIKEAKACAEIHLTYQKGKVR